MKNNPVFNQFNNAQNANVNPALCKILLEKQIRQMQSDGVNPDAIISQGISDGEINQQQANFALNIAKNVAKNVFGI